MTKLKLRVIQDNKPVKISIYIPAETHRHLIEYAKIHGDRQSLSESKARKADIGAEKNITKLSILYTKNTLGTNVESNHTSAIKPAPPTSPH
jgi:hypothetical protein